MPLNTGNILIFKSDTMSDTDAGGGNITNNVVTGGESNNVFDDVSPLNRTTGALHLRKLFTSVSIQTLDKYYGAHSIISKIPADNQTNVCLFSTNDWHDRRDSASKRIAGYYGKGVDYNGFLYGTAWEGSKALSIFQSEDSELPLVGDVLILTQGSDEQYIRVSDLESSVQSFTVGDVTFKRKIVTITTTNALESDFVGSAITDQDAINPPTSISTTIVANTAKYYSARPLDSVVVAGASEIKADTLFTQLVPNTLVETPYLDLDPSGNVTSNYSASDNTMSYTTSSTFQNGSTISTGGAVSAGTLLVETTIGNITDSAGNLLYNGTVIGSINYSSGVMTFVGLSVTFYGSKTINFTPAAPIVTVAASQSTEITIANRGSVFTTSVNQEIGKGTVSVSFMSVGSWYTLYDNGSGGLAGETVAIGSGSINYDTGSISTTLGELPDVGSEIIYSWGLPLAVEQVSTAPLELLTQATFDNTISEGMAAIIDLPSADNIDLSSLVITWSQSGTKTVTCDASGVLSGDATGRIIKTTTGHVVNMHFTSVPAQFTILNLAFDTNTTTSLITDYPTNKNVDDSIDFTIPSAPLSPGSASVYWEANSFDHQDTFTKEHITGTLFGTTYRDDGLGGFTDNNGNTIAGATINYTTGAVHIDPVRIIRVSVASIVDGNLVIIDSFPTVRPTTGVTDLTVKALTVSNSGSDATTHPLDVLQFVANGDGRAMDIVPGSTGFTWGGVDYFSNGYLITTLDGLVKGSINKNNGVVTMNSWTADLTNTKIELNSMLNIVTPVLPESPSGQSSYTGVSEFVFRIPAGAIKSESLNLSLPYLSFAVAPSQVNYYNPNYGHLESTTRTIDITRVDEELIITADANGDISSTNVGSGDAVATGTINYETGVVKLVVTSAGVEQFFDPSKITYSVTSKRFIPISSDLLGIDHVRLPENGRVPAYAVGDVVVIHNTRTVDVTVVDNDTTDVGQTNLSKVSVVDTNGTTLLSTQYSVDLITGILTWDSVAGLTMPLTVSYSIEDMSTLTDVQIDGTLGLTIPVTHDYPVAGTIVSNALIHGDMFANVSNPFDQQTWTGVWSDSQIGNSTLGEFNNTVYPIIVTNSDCIEERWLIQFTSSTLVNIIGEHSGQVLTGVSIANTSLQLAPVNPTTGFPYFTIDNKSFGGGWSSGNVIRFNTHAANAPIWAIQSVNQGAAGSTDEGALSFCIEFRGARNTIV